MPVVYCTVVSCHSRRGSGLSFFRCPKDEARCQVWRNQLGFTGSHRYANITPDQCYEKIRICSKHFTNESFTTPEKHQLNQNAIPTLFLLEPTGSSRVSDTHTMLKPKFQDAEVQTAPIQSDACAQTVYNKNGNSNTYQTLEIPETSQIKRESLTPMSPVLTGTNTLEEDHVTGDPLRIPFAEDRTGKTDSDKTEPFTSLKETSTRKRKANSICEEDADSLESYNKLQKDEYTLFGELVAIKLRQLPTDHSRLVVQHIINTTLFDAQMGKYNSPSGFPNGSGLSQPHNYYGTQMVKIESSMQSPSLEPYTFSRSESVTPGSVNPPVSPGSYGSGSQLPPPMKTEAEFSESFDML